MNRTGKHMLVLRELRQPCESPNEGGLLAGSSVQDDPQFVYLCNWRA